MTIYKYPLEERDKQYVLLPEGSEILSVQAQRGNICLWARVHPQNPTVKRTIEIFGTGHPMEEAARVFIGTFQMLDGRIILHAFERTN